MRVKGLLSILLIFISFSISGQSWQYREGSDPFDGKYKTSWIIGSGGDFPYTSPMLVINRYLENPERLNIYLSDVPSSICDGKVVLIKFDTDPYLFTVVASGSRDNDNWFLKFTDEISLPSSDIPSLSDKDLKDYKYADYIVTQYAFSVIIKAEPNSWSQTIYSAKPNDTIRVLNFDTTTNYWLVFYNDQTDHNWKVGFVSFKSIPTKYPQYAEIRNNPRSSDSIIKSLLSLKQRSATIPETELDKFIRYIKTHKMMHLRMLSDCVSADYKFSLTGSTAAMNFVFK